MRLLPCCHHTNQATTHWYRSRHHYRHKTTTMHHITTHTHRHRNTAILLLLYYYRKLWSIFNQYWIEKLTCFIGVKAEGCFAFAYMKCWNKYYLYRACLYTMAQSWAYIEQLVWHFAGISEYVKCCNSLSEQ